jgi:hypothetical protein
MGAFRSERVFWGTIPDLTPIVMDVVRHFRDRGFEAVAEPSSTGLWDVSFHKGGTLRAVAGLKLALKVLIVPEGDRLTVTAGVGIFGRQVAPAALGLAGVRVALVAAGATAATLVGLPLLVAGAWGLIKQSKLDDEAMAVVAESINRHAPHVAAAIGPPPPEHTLLAASVSAVSSVPPPRSCGGCGGNAEPADRFCGECGASLPA